VKGSEAFLFPIAATAQGGCVSGSARIRDHRCRRTIQASSAAGVVKRRPSVPLNKVWWYSVTPARVVTLPSRESRLGDRLEERVGLVKSRMACLDTSWPTGQGERQEWRASMRIASKCPQADERVVGRIT